MRTIASDVPRPVPLAVALLLAVLPGCEHSGRPTARVRANLDAARVRWEAAGLTGYAVTQSRTCFCPAPHEWTVVVMGGVPAFIDSVVDPGNTGMTEYALEQAALDQAMSVDALFTWIETEIGLGAVVDASFDPQLGYPTFISVDMPEIADDEIVWNLADLAPLPGCAKADCADELRVTLVAPSAGFVTGDYGVSVTYSDATSQSCAFKYTAAACQSPPCDLGGTSCSAFFVPPDRIVLSSLPFRLGTVQVSVEIDGVPVASPYLEPVYTRSQPNGSLCPPVCWTADVETTLP